MDSREAICEASVVVRMVGMMEQRNYIYLECRDCCCGRRQHQLHRFGEGQLNSTVSKEFRNVRKPYAGTWEIFMLPAWSYVGRGNKKLTWSGR